MTSDTTMDYPMIRKLAQPPSDRSHFVNGIIGNGRIENRILHSQEQDLPGGANWVIQKFGGTSVGKFGKEIVEEVVMYVHLLDLSECG